MSRGEDETNDINIHNMDSMVSGAPMEEYQSETDKSLGEEVKVRTIDSKGSTIEQLEQTDMEAEQKDVLLV